MPRDAAEHGRAHRQKIDIIGQFANRHKARIILQETHCLTADQLVIPNFALAGFLPGRKHGLATFVQERLRWTLVDQSPLNSETEWLCVNVDGQKVVNVYKPPPSPLSLPVFPHPCLYAGNFNCQHADWGYKNTSANGETRTLAAWATNNDLALIYDPKGPASFLSGHWSTRSNPDLAFASVGGDNWLPYRRVLEKFPRSQHRPSLITAPKLVDPVPNEAVKCWNFRNANWSRFRHLTDLWSGNLLHTNNVDVDKAYRDLCSVIISAAIKPVPRGRRSNYVPYWNKECEQLYRSFLRAAEGEESARAATALLDRLNRVRHEHWKEAVKSIDFTHSGRKEWGTINNLTGRSRHPTVQCPISANAIASQLVRNGSFKDRDPKFSRHVAKEVSDLWRAETNHSENNTISGDFTSKEFAAALQKLSQEKLRTRI